jgi:peptidoglycan/xylan/chitin deacetylase (PgdA/CDA1 family)
MSWLTRWLPSAFLRFSLLIQIVFWPAYFLVLNDYAILPMLLLGHHVLIFLLCLHPRNSLIGVNQSRIEQAQGEPPSLLLSFDDGPDPQSTPEVLAILDQFKVKALFFCIAERAQAYPDLIGEILARGHQIGNHSLRHETTFAFKGPRALAFDLVESQRILEALSGRQILWFRPPFGIRNPWMHGVLQQHNLKLMSWTRRGYDGVISDIQKILNHILKEIGPGDIILMHDGRSLKERPVAHLVLPELLTTLEAQGFKIKDPAFISP